MKSRTLLSTSGAARGRTRTKRGACAEGHAHPHRKTRQGDRGALAPAGRAATTVEAEWACYGERMNQKARLRAFRGNGVKRAKKLFYGECLLGSFIRCVHIFFRFV